MLDMVRTINRTQVERQHLSNQSGGGCIMSDPRVMGYARVSSTGQNLARQILELRKYVPEENIIVLVRAHLPGPAAAETTSFAPSAPGRALTEDADELGHAGHEALKVHTQAAVTVSARESLGQLVVQVEAWGRPPLRPGCPLSPPPGRTTHSDYPGNAGTLQGAWSHLCSSGSVSSQL